LSRLRPFAVAAVAALFILTPLRAQEEEKPVDEKEKEATRKLLAKAADEYRSFFKRPEKTVEFWSAIKFELEVGKFDLAALHLKLMLEKEPAAEVDADLAKIENVEGFGSFLKLTAVKKWSDHPPFQKQALKDVQSLLDRLTAAVDKMLSDPARFKKFIPQLDAPTVEERSFAFGQLNRSKERSASYLIDALRANVGKPLHRAIVDALERLDPEVVPAWLEALKANPKNPNDAQDGDMRLTLLSIIQRRGDTRAVPYLWHLSSSRIYPPQVNARAKQLLGQLTNTDPEALPPARIALTELADRYYQHKVRFPAGKPILVWPWDGAKLATKPVELTQRQAEEFYGLRHAREALDLEPTYLPAQMAFLNLTLDRTYGADLDQALLKPMPPSLQQLLGSIDSDLLLRVLERGLDERRPAVIIAATQALGDRGEVRAARAAVGGAPQGITRGLFYPDRRVQFASVKALLRMPATPVPVASTRVVEVLSRLVTAAPNPKALVVYSPPDQAVEIRQTFKESELEPVLAKNIKEAFEKFGPIADFEVVFLHGSAGGELPFAITQLRADADHGNVPIFILSTKQTAYALEKLAARHRDVKVIPESMLLMGEELKHHIDTAIATTSGARVTPAERSEFARVSLDYLWRMARQEIPGYDVRPAQSAVMTALRSPDTATEALEILSRLPGAEPQVRIAGVALDPGQDKVRIAAAMELNRHLQKYGLMLNRQQIAQVKQAHAQATDPQLKAQLAIILGAFGPSAQLTGSRLIQFRPDAPAPPPEKKEEKKEEKKVEKKKEAN
jgi:hypothetical protein